ncbi:MAG TPA: site-2 protease family protein [Planctomycetaceae bacterium]|jgi:stage IV sporulation protein FB|nr:site-2 protease family protein [Planctomycetaceae bacterium]
MDSRDNPLFWSIPCGNWFMTRVRVSILVPILILCAFPKFGWKVSLVMGAVFVVSLLIHELAHVFAVRLTGGVGNEILIWPLGGLAFVQPAGNFRSQFLTPAAGPFSNFVVCGAIATSMWRAGAFPAILNPLVFPVDPSHALGEGWALDVLKIAFWCNWILLLVNLLPAFPLDGIRMTLAVLKNRMDIESAADSAIRISFLASGLAMAAGLLVDSSWIVFFGALILFYTFFEWVQLRTSDTLDDSFMGYDFSQGYTSLERSTKQNQPAGQRRKGLIEGWREKRRVEKERRARLEVEQAQQQLDVILEKVHQQGMGSLSDAERRQLNRASARLRDRGKQA